MKLIQCYEWLLAPYIEMDMTEVLQHLMSVKWANVDIRLDIDVDLLDGMPENIVRTVSENCQTLKVQNFRFKWPFAE